MNKILTVRCGACGRKHPGQPSACPSCGSPWLETGRAARPDPPTRAQVVNAGGQEVDPPTLKHKRPYRPDSSIEVVDGIPRYLPWKDWVFMVLMIIMTALGLLVAVGAIWGW